MTSLDQLTPDQYRARYERLRANASNRPQPRPLPPAPIDPAAVLQSETIPEGWYQSFRLRAGEAIRITNVSGAAQPAAQIWNARDTAERFNVGDTVKLQWSVRLGAGKLLYSDMGRVLASIIADSSDGRHDAISGVSSAQSNLARYGEEALRNSRDNFRLAAAKLGLARRDIHPAISFFARTQVDQDGALKWLPGGRAGDCIDLRAELDLIIILSNCPHPLSPAPRYAPGPVEVTLWQPAPPALDDACRTSGEEAVRGFDNNRTYLRA